MGITVNLGGFACEKPEPRALCSGLTGPLEMSAKTIEIAVLRAGQSREAHPKATMPVTPEYQEGYVKSLERFLLQEERLSVVKVPVQQARRVMSSSWSAM